MTATWQSRLSDSGTRITAVLATVFHYLARPDVFPRFRQALVALLALWIVVSLWRGALSFVPEAAPLPPMTVINPTTQTASSRPAEGVDINRLVAMQLFGEPGSELSSEDLAAAGGRSPAMSEEEAAVALAGIEDGAPETRLPLVLRGVVASTEAGLGQAVIEHRNNQDLYQVGDELPVNGKVSLAKVLPSLVVLDNGGRYEVLKLFQETGLSRQAASIAQRRAAAKRASTDIRPAPEATETGADDVPSEEDAAALAARYREQLYRDPESLADVIRVTAVREGGALRGYRIRPGRRSEEFTALGFVAGDVVTAVNGLSLADPANTVRLYQAMRTAQAASFEVERDGSVVTLDVSIGGGSGG